MVGDNPASTVYVRNKAKACAAVGIRSTHLALPEDVAESVLLERVAQLNADTAIHGILVQLPLPKQISPQRVTEAIHPDKDVDGFHPLNAGLLASGYPRFVPCTPAAIMALLADEGVALRGLHAVVVGASNVVGKPVASLLLQAGATVTLCNSKTRDLGAHTRSADILVAAAGRTHLVRADMVKAGAVVVDVGIHRMPDGTLAGDCDFAAMLGKVAAITPVPGGVGPMTITMLLANTLQAAELASLKNSH
jgi:methylenetetrahydrofolate dehydrogenase (NADP+) / methenyltetrahydrofolate cyclohydrolase